MVKYQGGFGASSTCVWLLLSPSMRSQLVEILYVDGNVLKWIIMLSRFTYLEELPRTLLCYLQNNFKIKENPWSIQKSIQKALPLNSSFMTAIQSWWYRVKRVWRPWVCSCTNVAWTNGSSLLYVRFFICQMGSPLGDFYLMRMTCRDATGHLRGRLFQTTWSCIRHSQRTYCKHWNIGKRPPLQWTPWK